MGPVGATKRCPRCGETKPRGEFAKGQARCKPCNTARLSAWKEANSERYREQQRHARLKQRFNLTPAQYAALLAAQGGACYWCGRRPNGRRLGVDHDHETGLIRGLLCARSRHSCNSDFVYRAEKSWRAGRPLHPAVREYFENPPAVAVIGRVFAPMKKTDKEGGKHEREDD